MQAEISEIQRALQNLANAGCESQLVVDFQGDKWWARLHQPGANDPHIVAQGLTLSVALYRLGETCRLDREADR